MKSPKCQAVKRLKDTLPASPPTSRAKNKNMNTDNKVFTENKGWLTTETGFQFLRGTLDAFMGYAHDEQGNHYEVRVSACDLEHCNCASTAKKIGHI